MKSTRFASFCGRTTVALIFVSSLFLFSCSQNDEAISDPPVSILQVLSNSDPIAGTFSTLAYSVYGSDTAFIFQENIAYATSCSCSNLESTEGKTEGKDFQKINSYGTDLFFDLSSSEKIYVNYNGHWLSRVARKLVHAPRREVRGLVAEFRRRALPFHR